MEAFRERDTLMDAIQLIDKTLASLKDFQRETVKSVIASFQHGGSQRVLVADEVGLGKTIVAKGVIAELLKARLEGQAAGEKASPLRVTYICSNLTLADENRKKLAVFHGDSQAKYVLEPSYSRLLETALVSKLVNDKDKILELCSLTPATSFHMTRGHGNWRERLIVYFSLVENEELSRHRTKLSNFFSSGVGNWSDQKEILLRNHELCSKVVAGFHKLLGEIISERDRIHCGIDLPQKATWMDALLAFCREGMRFKKTDERFRACIRSLLAQSCAKHLTADLFILDEFQRFKDLLDSNEQNDDSLVAREIFSKKKTMALLLSATPFKAVSRSEDDEDGNAHAEELNYLLKFLSSDDLVFLEEYEVNRKALQQQILKLRDTSNDLRSIDSGNKFAIERLLGPYLCRTERVQISDGYENLFCSDVPDDIDRIKNFSRNDIEIFKVMDRLGLALQKDHPGRSVAQLMEFYKSSPWPLSFLSGYQFKKDLDKYVQDGPVRQALKNSDAAWLSRNKIQTYQLSLENAPQAKMRALVKRLFKTPSEELLWVPPSMPHYSLQGSFEHQQDFSKTLLFSSWAMVPRALSSLISYEAERRLLSNRKGLKKAYFKDGKHTATIRFDAKSSLVGWALVYPAKVLCDMPLDAGSASLNEMIKQRTAELKKKVTFLRVYEQGPKSGDRWYALAPMLLDLYAGNEGYLSAWIDTQQNSISTRDEHKGIAAQFNILRGLLKKDSPSGLGPMPEDLAEYLAYLSVAGPAVSVCRTLNAHWPENSAQAASSATDVAFSMVAMFNKPEAESILNKRFPQHRVQQKYFQAVVRYCADGGLQAVMDEYGHLLKDAGFPMVASNNTDADSATKRMIEVLSIKTVSVACQFAEQKLKSSEDTQIKADKANNRHSLRCHYAVPLGSQKMTDESALQRVGSIRDTFNSPFRPFVLNSTSIGQEGLDFHWYCSQIVHWNLPSNPIDIEQREGRINRYKSLVVRRRLAEMYKDIQHFKTGDVWKQLFDVADKQTKPNRASDLVPYWHLPEGSAQIIRFVPMMPLSRDVSKLEHALKVLSIYRLAFGQPRQEELLDNLLKRKFSDVEIGLITKKLVIDLSPMNRRKKPLDHQCGYPLALGT
jgi:hypothetical protein